MTVIKDLNSLTKMVIMIILNAMVQNLYIYKYIFALASYIYPHYLFTKA